MARSLKIAFWIVLVAVIGLGTVPFLAVRVIDWNGQRDRLAALLSEASGLAVSIDGDLEVDSLVPRARVSVGGIAVSAGRRRGAAPVSVERLDLDVDLWPLLGGVLDVRRLRIVHPRLAYEIDELGRETWIAWHDPGFAEDDSEDDGEAGRPLIRDIRIGALEVSDGALLYDDQQTGQTLHAEALNLKATLPSLGEPLELRGRLDLNRRAVVLTAALDSPETLIGSKGAHLSTSVKSALLQIGLDLETWLEPHLGVNGAIDIEAPSVGQLATWLDRPLGEMDDPGVLRLSGRLSSTETEVALDALKLSNDDWQLVVSGGVDFDVAPTRLSLNIEGDYIDLDRYLPPRSDAPRRLRLGPPRPDQDRDGLDEPIDLSVLSDFQGEMRIALDGLKVQDFEIGWMAFRAKLADSVMALELGELNLYGGRLLGQVNLDAAGEVPSLDAKMAIDRVDLDSFYETGESDPIIGGEINGAINITSRGGTPRELIQALNGSVLLELDPNRELNPADSVVSKANVQIIIPENDENPYLLGRLFYGGEDVTFDVEVAPLPKIVTEPGFALDASVEAGLASLTYQGDVYHSPIVSLNGDLNADMPSAGRTAAWLGAPLPRDPGPVTVKASLESNGTEGQIKEAYLRGEDLNAEVSGNFDFSGEISTFNFTAKTGVLRLDRYLPERSGKQDEGTGDSADSGKDADGQRTVLLLEDLPEDPFDLEAFRRLKGKIEIASDGVVLPNFVIGQVAVEFQTDDGVAKLDIEELAINESTLTGKVGIDGRQAAAAVDLSLEGAKIDFDTLLPGEGRAGWPSFGRGDIAIAATARGRHVKDLVKSLAPRIDATLASVALDDHRTLEDLTLKAESDGVTSDVSATSSALLVAPQSDRLDVALEITGDPIAKLLDNDLYAVRGNATLADVRLEVDAQIDDPLTRATPSLQFRSAGDSLATLAAVLETELPVYGPYEVKGRVDSRGSKTELSDFALALGRSKASGGMTLDTGAGRPSLSGNLTFETLDVTEYIDEDQTKDDSASATDWIFDETPLPFELLSEADITDFEVAITELKVDPEVVFTDVRSTLALTDATLRLSDLRGRLYDGDLNGQFQAAQDGASPSALLELKGTNLDYGVFLQAFDITRDLRGRVDINLDLDGKGESLRAIASDLSGRIDLNARDGEFDREMLGILAFGTGSILRPLLGTDDRGKLDCIVSTLTFEDGLGKSLVQYYETSSFAMAGKGEINLKNETVDFLYNPTSREASLMRLATPFRVKGPLQSPSVQLDTGGALLEVAKTAGTIASFINPLVGLGVLASQVAIQNRDGCETANKVQRGEIAVEDPESKENPFLNKKERN